VTVWVIVYYISLAIPFVLAFMAEESTREKVMVVALSLGLGAWYALVMMWILPKASGRWQVAWVIIFLVGAVVMWFPLARTHWAYFITASSFYGLMWGTLPFGMAVA